MAALSVTNVTAGACTDGTRQLSAVGILGADGAKFQPAMKDPASAGYGIITDGTNSLALVGATPALPVAAQAVASGGATPYSALATGTTQDATVVKAAAGTLYSVSVASVVAGLRYLKIYDKATAPVVGDTPKFRIPIPGNTAGTLSNVHLPACGVAFASGIGYRITTGIADADVVSATANDCAVNMVYA